MILIILCLQIGIFMDGGLTSPDKSSQAESVRKSISKDPEPVASRRAPIPIPLKQTTDSQHSSGNLTGFAETSFFTSPRSPIGQAVSQAQEEFSSATFDGETRSQQAVADPTHVAEDSSPEASQDHMLMVKGISAVLTEKAQLEADYLKGLLVGSQATGSGKSPHIVFVVVVGNSEENRLSFAKLQPHKHDFQEYRLVDSFLGHNVRTSSFVFVKKRSKDGGSSGVTARLYEDDAEFEFCSRYAVYQDFIVRNHSCRETTRVLVEKSGSKPLVLGLMAMDAFWDRKKPYKDLKGMVKDIYLDLKGVGPSHLTVAAGLLSPKLVYAHQGEILEWHDSRISVESTEKNESLNPESKASKVTSKTGKEWREIAGEWDKVGLLMKEGNLLTLKGEAPTFPPTFQICQDSYELINFSWANRVLREGPFTDVPGLVREIGQDSFGADKKNFMKPVAADLQVDLAVFDKQGKFRIQLSHIKFNYEADGMEVVGDKTDHAPLKLVVSRLDTNDGNGYHQETDWVTSEEFYYEPARNSVERSLTSSIYEGRGVPIIRLKVRIEALKKEIIKKKWRADEKKKIWKDIGSTLTIAGKLDEKEVLTVSGKLFFGTGLPIGSVEVRVKCLR